MWKNNNNKAPTPFYLPAILISTNKSHRKYYKIYIYFSTFNKIYRPHILICEVFIYERGKKWHSFQNCHFFGWRLVGNSYSFFLWNRWCCTGMKRNHLLPSWTREKIPNQPFGSYTWGNLWLSCIQCIRICPFFVCNFFSFFRCSFRAINRSCERNMCLFLVLLLQTTL